MCGIVGYISSQPYTPDEWTTIERILVRLLVAAERRGTDATGVAYLYNHELFYDKQPVPANVYIKQRWPALQERFATRRPTVCVGHTRAKTVGAASDNLNNHPIVSKALGLAMVHNGCFGNYEALFAAQRLRREGAVDSEVLLRLVEADLLDETRKQRINVATAVVNAYRQVSGSAATAFIGVDYPRSLVLARDGAPLWLGLRDDLHTIFFASTEGILRDAMGQRTTKYDFFSTRDECPQLLTQEIADESLVVINAQSGHFRIGARDCPLKIYAYASGTAYTVRTTTQQTYLQEDASYA